MHESAPLHTAGMSTAKPSDIFLDRYMPEASAEEREAALDRLRRLARVLVRIEKRLARERYETWIREKGDGAVNSNQSV